MAAYCLLMPVLLTVPVQAHTSGTQAQPIVLGDSTVTLNGPWKFRTGDDARWADPAFDDSAWENVDLTPSPGANDGVLTLCCGSTSRIRAPQAEC
jgi:hypothetical protein